MLNRNGSKQQTIKEKNRALVLQCVLNRNILSRAEIARYLGLTKTTLTNIVNELIADDILIESETISSNTAEGSSGMGRKSIGLALSPKAPLIGGVLIQRGNFHVVFSDLQGRLVTDQKYTYSGLISPEEFQTRLKELFNNARAHTGRPLLAIGLSCAGPLNIVEGKLLNPHNFFTLPYECDIVSFFSELTDGLPVYLCNDATAGAIAEKLFGVGRNEDNFVYISTFNGIGAGLYLNNKLYNGEFGQNGELGHMSINFMGPKCSCGNNGCLELYTDIQRIIDDYDHFKAVFPRHPFFQKRGNTILDVLSLIDDGDVLAMAVMSEYCKYLACAVSNLIAQLNIKLVILAGSSKTENPFFERTLAHMVNKQAFMAKYQKNLVVKSPFGLDSPLYGSVGIVIDKIFNGEIYPVAAGVTERKEGKDE